MLLLLPNFLDFWQHCTIMYSCYGYGTFATRWDLCCKIRKRYYENIIGSNMDDRSGDT